MNPAVLFASALTGFGVAFLHAAIPVHWLPFVLAGRVQGWALAQTLGVTMLAGVLHVLATAVLGALAAALGVGLGQHLEGRLAVLVAGVLVLFALHAYWRQWGPRRAHGHGHAIVAPRSRRSDRAVTAGLVGMLLLSPCEAFIPIYVTGVPYGWGGFVLLTAVLAVATLGAMALFVLLAWRGLATPGMHWLEQHEPAVFGTVLLLLAALVWFVL
ncbi:MAG TPA: hypothetical protein VFN09_16035 [Rhodanobacteraceae bacterium]|nr:hypothetical protein [Rhodanobacteraceae bacterium]